MVGDRLDTDILFGKHGGFKTCLVESGCHQMEDIMNAEKHKQPDYIISSVAEFI